MVWPRHTHYGINVSLDIFTLAMGLCRNPSTPVLILSMNRRITVEFSMLAEINLIEHGAVNSIHIRRSLDHQFLPELLCLLHTHRPIICT